MKYYKTQCGLLIQYNDETKTYKQRNVLSLSNVYITEFDFLKLQSQRLKQHKFFELLNDYFKSVKHKWKHNGVTYRKLDNFEYKNNIYNITTNYKIGTDIPYHKVLDYDKLFLVYYRGRVFYCLIRGQYYPKLYLLSTKDLSVKHMYISLKNCSPIYNTETKQIM